MTLSDRDLLEIRNTARKAQADHDLAHSTDCCYMDVFALLSYIQELKQQIKDLKEQNGVLYGYLHGKPVEIQTNTTTISTEMSNGY